MANNKKNNKHKIKSFKGKVSSLREKLDKERQMGDKVKELIDRNVDLEYIRDLTVQEFEDLYQEYAGAKGKLDAKRLEFYKDLEYLEEKWSPEEIFVYMIDILNGHLMTVAEENMSTKAKAEGTTVEVEDIFPVLYDKIYNNFVEILKERYEQEGG